MKNTHPAYFSLFLLISLILTAQTAFGQAARVPAAAPAAAPAASATKLTPKVEAFQKALKAYAGRLEKAESLQQEYLKPETSETRKEEIGTELEEIGTSVGKFYPQMVKLAEAAWMEAPGATDELIIFITQVIDMRMTAGNYESAAKLLRGMLTTDYPQKLPEIYDVAGEVFFVLNEYDSAEKFFKMAEQKKVISDESVAWQKLLPYYKVAWAREKTLRDREKTADDLPRVLLKTTKGDITLELFENDAPNTVANFISLVEKKFYDGSPFHNVIPGFMAQTGTNGETGEPGPGYRIACEASKPGARKHFRGSASMAITEKDTGGSQFFLCFTPNKDLDSVNTVFGRIISGWDAFSEITPVNAYTPDPLAEPDMILSAEVIRKRDHAYKPEIIRDGAAAKTTKKPATPAKTGPSAY